MPATLFTNARVFDGVHAEWPDGMQVLVEDGVIREVSDKPIKVSAARVINVFWPPAYAGPH